MRAPLAKRRFWLRALGVMLLPLAAGCHRGSNLQPQPFGGLREYFAERPTYPLPPPSQRLTLGSYAAYNYGPRDRPGAQVVEPAAPLFGF